MVVVRLGDGNIKAAEEKILFIHNTAMWYRIPFFRSLARIYNIKYIFTHLDVSKNVYDVELSPKIEGMEETNYVILKNYFNIAFGVFGESMGKYDILVGGSWDSLPEIIETAIYFTIAKIRRKKFILWSEDWNWKIKTAKRKTIKLFAKLIIKNSDAILVPGTKHKECVVYLGSNPDKVFIMPNASNFSDNINFSNEFIDKNLKQKKIILFVGRLVKQKGVDYLLEAFRLLKEDIDDLVLLIIGNGDYEKNLKIKVKDLKIENYVCFLGRIDNDSLYHYYKISDVCVVPSITDEMVDAWAFVVNEAMFCAKPVIASEAVGSAYDMIKNGENGFMVPERDSKALYDSLKTIFTDDKLKKDMGIMSKKMVENHFSYKNMVDGFINAINYVKK